MYLCPTGSPLASLICRSWSGKYLQTVYIVCWVCHHVAHRAFCLIVALFPMPGISVQGAVRLLDYRQGKQQEQRHKTDELMDSVWNEPIHSVLCSHEDWLPYLCNKLNAALHKVIGGCHDRITKAKRQCSSKDSVVFPMSVCSCGGCSECEAGRISWRGTGA